MPMTYLKRTIAPRLQATLDRDKNVLLLGPRQTGKTTLTDHIQANRTVTFVDPRERLRYEKNPGVLIDEINALAAEHQNPTVIIDEVQKVPAIMDAVQYLIDKKIAKFILTGSSARKLKRDGDVNLLPGRVIPIYLDALMLNELPECSLNITDLLLYGSLPEIILTEQKKYKEELLDAYVITYLEEEIRMESVVRNLAAFAQFLELAAGEAGYVMNMSKLSQKIGVANTTIESYFHILEDCLIVEKIEPITTSKKRHRLNKANKYLFYDLGVRRVAAREGVAPPQKYWGHLFEQFVGIELVRVAKLQSSRCRLRHWKDANGPEVDWVVETPDAYIPIEVKWDDAPSLQDARHLQTFIDEYEKAACGYIVCQTPRRMKLSDQIMAIPWQEMHDIF